MIRHVAFMLLLLSGAPAVAFDWTQPILNELEQPIPDCPGDPTAKCGRVLTIGMLAARQLLSAGQTAMSPEQKALEGNFGLQILLHPDLVPTPDQLKLARDAVGRHASPLAVARGWNLLDAAVK